MLHVSTLLFLFHVSGRGERSACESVVWSCIIMIQSSLFREKFWFFIYQCAAMYGPKLEDRCFGGGIILVTRRAFITYDFLRFLLDQNPCYSSYEPQLTEEFHAVKTLPFGGTARPGGRPVSRPSPVQKNTTRKVHACFKWDSNPVSQYVGHQDPRLRILWSIVQHPSIMVLKLYHIINITTVHQKQVTNCFVLDFCVVIKIIKSQF
jgi:hypothetical protein